MQANGSKCPLDTDTDTDTENDTENEKGVWGGKRASVRARRDTPPLPLGKRQENSSPVFFAYFSQPRRKLS